MAIHDAGMFTVKGINPGSLADNARRKFISLVTGGLVLAS